MHLLEHAGCCKMRVKPTRLENIVHHETSDAWHLFGTAFIDLVIDPGRAAFKSVRVVNDLNRTFMNCLRDKRSCNSNWLTGYPPIWHALAFYFFISFSNTCFI